MGRLIAVALAPSEPIERDDVDFSEASRRPVGTGLRVVLVGFQDQDNLGLRYLQSAARHHGHDCRIVTYANDAERLAAEVIAADPAVVGLSLIFQYMAPQFGQLVEALRAGGFTGHITMGGHYPSFDPGEILTRIDGLDSVVCYEGELTFVELLGCLERGAPWRHLRGLACHVSDADRTIVVNEHRMSLEDLDELPLPDRSDVDYEHQELPTASMLASRGCPWNCSFCSIRPFYEAPGGALRRLRRPKAVAAEMVALHRDRGVVAFLFQDDDFMATGRRGRAWAVALAEEIGRSELAGRVSLKISCRSDEVNEEAMRILRDEGGLTHVYLGVESGDPVTLEHLRKQLKPQAHIAAANVFRKLNMSFDFGYMVLEPYSTFESVRSGIDFLDEFVGDGWTVATFCRTLPYAGTPIADKLRAEGRLLGSPFDPDYNFLDPRLDHFYDWMLHTFHRRNFTDAGLCHILRGLQFELHLDVAGRRLATAGEQAMGRYLASVANRTATHTLRSALEYCEANTLESLQEDSSYLLGLTQMEHESEQRLEREAYAFYDSFRATAFVDVEGLPGGFQHTYTPDPVRASVG
jgi:anaerobic magnesium-protoporphyrin IX monomethyl ester cyclase